MHSYECMDEGRSEGERERERGELIEAIVVTALRLAHKPEVCKYG